MRSSEFGVRNRRAGQALVETLIGLIGLVVLAAALLQFTSLFTTDTRLLLEAREEAGALSMQSPALLQTPAFLSGWTTGDDGRDYTRDDERVYGAPAGFAQAIVDKSAPTAAGWAQLAAAPEQAFSDMHGSGAPHTAFDMTSSLRTDTIPLLPAVRHMLYARDTVDLENEVWMTWTEGIY